MQNPRNDFGGFNWLTAGIRVVVALAVLILGVLPGFGLSRVAAADGPLSVKAADLDAQVATEWMTLLYKRIEADAISAPAGSRLYAYMGITLYNAVLPGIPNDNSLGGQISEMPDMPDIDGKLAYDWPTTANVALANVAKGLFTGPSTSTAESLKAFEALRAKLLAERAAKVDDATIKNSVAYGDEIGKAMLAWISGDHFDETRSMKYTLPQDKPESYVLTTDGTKPVEPFWGQIRPLAMQSSDVCNVKLNIAYSTDPSSTFYAQAMEVKTVKDNLTPEQKAIANFWVDTPGITGTPSGHWVMIEVQLVDQLKLRLDKAAEMFALVGMALGDSFISCWEYKYQVLLLRPETYIKQNIRRGWAPYIQTPPFPTYPSGHSVVSAAAAEVLTAMFGIVAFKDDTHKVHNMPARFFTSFEAAADEAAISRLYGGIHYRVDIENGLKQGRCVGQNILNRIQLQPRPQGAG